MVVKSRGSRAAARPRSGWRRRSARWFALVAALGVVAASLAACGSASNSSSSGTGAGTASSAGAGTGGGSATKFGPALKAPAVSAAAFKATDIAGFDYYVPPAQLAPYVRDAIALEATPLTPQQSALLKKCLHETVCTTGPGKLSVADLEDAGNVPYRKLVRAVIDSIAIRIPAIGKVYYTDANGSLAAELSNFRTLMSEHVNIITGIFDYASSMRPLATQATAQGIQVIPGYTNYMPDASPSDVSFQVGLNLCDYGKNYAATAIAAGPKTGGTAVLLTGVAGNPFGAGWQPCAEKALEAAGWKVLSHGTTSDSPQGETQEANAIISSGHIPDAIMYDYTGENILNEFLRLHAHIPTLIMSSATLGFIRDVKKAYDEGYHFKAYMANSDIWFGAISVVGGVLKAQGAKIPFNALLPQNHIPVSSLFGAAAKVSSIPSSGNLNTLLPLDIIQQSF